MRGAGKFLVARLVNIRRRKLWNRNVSKNKSSNPPIDVKNDRDLQETIKFGLVGLKRLM